LWVELRCYFLMIFDRTGNYKIINFPPKWDVIFLSSDSKFAFNFAIAFNEFGSIFIESKFWQDWLKVTKSIFFLRSYFFLFSCFEMRPLSFVSLLGISLFLFCRKWPNLTNRIIDSYYYVNLICKINFENFNWSNLRTKEKAKLEKMYNSRGNFVKLCE